MADYYVPLHPNEKYHIFGRAVGAEKLFLNTENYRFFLSRFQRFISPIADVYCYCLLPNHFHFLIKTKEEPALISWHGKPIPGETIATLIMRQFSKLLNSYAKAFNKAQSRKGGLFMDYLRRVKIETDEQLAATAFYIHKNPVHHGYCLNMKEWQWSSYTSIVSEQPSNLLREELLGCFGGRKPFTDYHTQPVYLKQAIAIE